MSLKQLVGIGILLVLHGSALFAQPGPFLMLQNSNLVISVSTLLSNGVPGFTNNAATLTVGSISQPASGGKVSLLGKQSWVSKFDGPQNLGDAPLDAVVDHGGNVVVTGDSFSYDSDSDFITVKYSPGGVALWTNRFDGPTHMKDYARHVAVDSANNVYVSGERHHADSFDAPLDVVTIKYSPGGTPIWTNTYNPTGTNRLLSVSLAVDASGNAYIQWNDFTTMPNARGLLKYDTDGVLLWTNHMDQRISALDDHGDLFTAEQFSFSKLASDGTVIWSNAFLNSFDEPNYFAAQIAAIAVDPEGNLSVTGVGVLPFGYVTVKYSPNGVPLWTNFTAAPDYPGGNVPTVDCDRLGNVFVTGGGVLSDGNDADFTTIKYSPDGIPLWTNRFFESGMGNSYLAGTAVDNAGNFYLAGNAMHVEANGLDFFTVKYGADGGKIWTNYYNGLASGPDYPTDLVVADSGHVHVIGISDDLVGGWNYGTVTYTESIFYTPPRGFNGFDTFTFTVFDQFGNSTNCTVTVQVVPLATGMIDQRNDASDLLLTHGNVGIFNRIFGQEFVPTANAIGFVDLSLGTSSDVELWVTLREETLDGPVVGTSEITLLSPGALAPRFFFSPPVSVTPGSKYVIQIEGVVDYVSIGMNATTGNDYPLGQMVRKPASDLGASDLWFRTGLFAPPSDSVIYLQNTDRQLARWQLNNITLNTNELLAGGTALPQDGRLGGFADFDHDGVEEMFWQKNDGASVLRSFVGTEFVDSVFVSPIPLRNPASWKVAAVGDLNGDGETDVLWRNAKGRLDFWQMNGGDFVSSTLLSNALDPVLWKVVGIADLNRDTHNDIVAQRTDGLMRVWFMEGTNRVGVVNLMRDGLNVMKINTVAGWRAAGLADFNADNDPDILLSNIDGRQAVWMMSQTRKTFTCLLRDGRKVNPKWRIVGAR